MVEAANEIVGTFGGCDENRSDSLGVRAGERQDTPPDREYHDDAGREADLHSASESVTSAGVVCLMQLGAQADDPTRSDGLFDVAIREVRGDGGEGEPERQELSALERHVEARAGDHEDGPVPQVEAVGPHAYPLQRPAAEHAGHDAGGGVYGDSDNGEGRERDHDEATVIEELVEVPGFEEECAEPGEAGYADQVEGDGRASTHA